MTKEILSINKDDYDTEVNLKVPSFLNFGARMGALERESFEVLMGRQAGKDPNAPPPVDIKSMLSDMADREKKMLEQMPAEFSGLLSGFFTEIENLKIDDTPPVYDEKDFECFNHDLQALSVVCPEDSDWDKAAEAKVDQFLADWPEIRPRVLQALCDYYENWYPQIEHFNDPILMPAPGAPDLLEDRARITTIYLHEDGLIGLGGECTWEDEHALGVLLENGKVIDCGYASVAYEERYEEE